MTKDIKCNTKDIHEFMEFKSGWDSIKGSEGFFEYFPFEKNVVNHINDNRFSIIKKSRQMHMTTVLATYGAWNMLTQDKNVYYFGNRLDAGKHFVRKVKSIIENANPKIKYNRNTTVEGRLEDGTLLKCFSSSVCASKGHTLDGIVIIDEAAYLNNFSELLSVLLPTISVGCKVIVVSTPNGVGDGDKKLNGFFELYQSSIVGENNFNLMSINYKDNPRFDKKWNDHMMKILSPAQYKQEVLAEFVQSEEIKKINKKLDSIIQFRLSDDLLNKLSRKLIKEDVNISKYMRNLILKDVNV